MPQDPKVPNPPDKNYYQLLQKARSIQPDQPQMDRKAFAENHPILQGLANFLTGGATDPNTQIGPADVAMAGIPFAAPLGKVFHGTPNAFEHFDPSNNKIFDVLGHYTHFAENPADAANWAEGKAAHAGYNGQNVIPAKLKVQNALDIMNPDPEDLAKLAAHLPTFHQKEILRAIGENKRDVNGRLVNLKLVLNRALYENPEALQNAGFDAIRYHDVDAGPSWAVPDPNLAETPWGAPLGSGQPVQFRKPSMNAPEEQVHDYMADIKKSNEYYQKIIDQYAAPDSHLKSQPLNKLSVKK